MTTKLEEGGGVKALVVGPLNDNLFVASLSVCVFICLSVLGKP